jgi:hypothetical protein
MPTIDELDEQRESIRYTLALYPQRLDARDAVGWSELFAESGTFIVPRGHVSGRAAIRQDMIDEMAKQPSNRQTKHLSGEPIISINGDTAEALTDFIAAQRFGDGPWEILGIGRYEDRLIRLDGGWLFVENRVTHVAHEVPR